MSANQFIIIELREFGGIFTIHVLICNCMNF